MVPTLVQQLPEAPQMPKDDAEPPGFDPGKQKQEPEITEEDRPTPRLWIQYEEREINEDGNISTRVIVEIIHPDGKEEHFMF